MQHQHQQEQIETLGLGLWAVGCCGRGSGLLCEESLKNILCARSLFLAGNMKNHQWPTYLSMYHLLDPQFH
eukprot:scaffold1768_cov275-Chaetoceros_neogracile.AAC.16